MRNEDFAVHVRRRRFVSKIICEGVVGGGCNGNQSVFMKKVVSKKCSCCYAKRKRDVSGITPSSVANDAVDQWHHLRLTKGLFPKRLVSFFYRSISTFLKTTFFIR